MISFMHFRRQNNGKIESRGGVTIAYKTDAKGNVEKYAVARCSTNDNYDRKRGRELSGGRLQYPAFTHTPAVADASAFRAGMAAEMQSLGLIRPGLRRQA